MAIGWPPLNMAVVAAQPVLNDMFYNITEGNKLNSGISGQNGSGLIKWLRSKGMPRASTSSALIPMRFACSLRARLCVMIMSWIMAVGALLPLGQGKEWGYLAGTQRNATVEAKCFNTPELWKGMCSLGVRQNAFMESRCI